MTNKPMTESQDTSYMDRNGGWIKAAAGCLILAVMPMVLERIDPGAFSSSPWLVWLTFIGLMLGSVSLGYGLWLARTVTARIAFFSLIVLGTLAAIDVLLVAVKGWTST